MMKFSRLGFTLQCLLLTLTEGFTIKPYQTLGPYRSIDGQSNNKNGRHYSSSAHGALHLSTDLNTVVLSSSSILTSMDAWTASQYNTAGLIIAVSTIFLLKGSSKDETPVLDSKEVAESEDWAVIHEQATARANLKIATQEEREKAKALELEAEVRKQKEIAAAKAKKQQQEEEAERQKKMAEKMKEEERQKKEAERMKKEQEEKERQRKEEEEARKQAQEVEAEKERIALELRKRQSLATAKAATVAEKFEIERASEKRALELKTSSTTPPAPKKKDMNVKSTFQEKMEQVVEKAFRTETKEKEETTTTSNSDYPIKEVEKETKNKDELTTTNVETEVPKKDLSLKTVIKKRSVIVTAVAIVVVQRLIRVFFSKSML